MKTKITLLFFAACSLLKMNSQVVLVENFDPTNPPTSNGWIIQNNSNPVGPADWFQGNPGAFSAYNGTVNAYFAANYQSVPQGTPGTGDISTWLMTPTLNITNGAVFQFATRSTSAPTKGDRLQIRMSDQGAASTIPTGTASVGTFTNLMLDINPNLSTANASVISNGSVNGYPQNWVVYSLTVTGVTSTVQGRFAFLYLVPNGGENGANSRYIGIDGVKYSLPCANPTITVAQSTTGVCSGNTVNLVASGAASYTWNTGSNSATITPIMNATTVFTVEGESTPACYSTKTVAVSVTLTPNLAAPSITTCVSTLVSLNASGATTYSWTNGPTTPNYLVTSPASANGVAVYTITGFGVGGNCPNTKTVSVTSGTNLSVFINSSALITCPAKTTTLTGGGGAASYSWSTGSTNNPLVVAPNANTNYTLYGTTGSCTGSAVITISVFPSLTLVATWSPGTVCPSSNFVATATGADTFTWTLSPNNSFTDNPMPLIAPSATTGINTQFTLAGTSSDGCTAQKVVQIFIPALPVVTAAPDREEICTKDTVTWRAYGATNYTWTPGGAGVYSNPRKYTSGSNATKVNVFLTGESNGCFGNPTAVFTQTVVLCNLQGVPTINGGSEVSVFPNPFTNELKFEGIGGRVEIFNALGQLVTSSLINGDGTVDTDSFSKGVYIVQVHSSDGDVVKTVKLLKN